MPHAAPRNRRIRRRTAAATPVAGTLAPLGVLAATNAPAGAQNPIDPLGPTITQAEQLAAEAAANTQNELAYIVAASGWLASDASGGCRRAVFPAAGHRPAARTRIASPLRWLRLTP